MNLSKVTPFEAIPDPWDGRGVWKSASLRRELSALAALLVLLNLPLLHGACAGDMIFLPRRVAEGEWWRVFTHPFVHVSWYHLVLDSSAFLLLYSELDNKGCFGRIGCLLACGATSLLVSLWAAPLVQTHGLCGLSGIAHGLMTISALEMVRAPDDKTVRRAGMITLILVVTKCVLEAATGHIVFERFHFGALGSPIAVCHAGGALGGLGAWMMAQRLDSIRRSGTKRC
ncbi:MAG: rhombosortase [Verrucomicrobia bacterium]|nr:MAG: rhombosortase [Verrucomicrobiota bacterium]